MSAPTKSSDSKGKNKSTTARLGLSDKKKAEVYELLTHIDSLLITIICMYFPFRSGKDKIDVLIGEYDSREQEFENRKAAACAQTVDCYLGEVDYGVAKEQAALNRQLARIKKRNQEYQRQMDKLFEEVYEHVDRIRKFSLQPRDLLPSKISDDDTMLAWWMMSSEAWMGFSALPVVAERIAIAHSICRIAKDDCRDLRAVIEEFWQE